MNLSRSGSAASARRTKPRSIAIKERRATAMPGYPSSNPAQFIQGAPVLHVPDVESPVSFYRDVLGFISDFADEHYAVVWRDNSAIHFVKSDRPPSGVHLFQWVRNVDACYREVKGRGAEITAEPGDRPYGVRDFSVRDPNGVSIIFGQDIEPKPAVQAE
jgi:catechol 2,3-dioxygenase-like lactoylglutathione lyase family enzyme